MDREDRRRYLVVGSVFMEVILPVFRNRLDNHYKSLGFPSLRDFINKQPVLHILFHLRHRNVWCCTDRHNCLNGLRLPLYHYQWNLLYTENPGPGQHHCHCKYTAKQVQLDDLDITLSGLILLNCCQLPATEDEAVERLRQYKNDYLSHNTTGGITQDEYDTLWTDLKTYTLQIDPSMADKLKIIEKRPLDESLCNKYFVCLLDVHKKLEEMDSKMDTYAANVTTKLDEHTKMLETIMKNVSGQSSMDKAELQGFISYIMSMIKPENKQQKPYRLGQDIFRLHHQTGLTSVLNVDSIRYLSDGVMMDDGRLVLCLHKPEGLLICNTDGSEVNSIPLQGKPLYVTAVNNSTVAVTLPLSDCIEMYDINNKHKLKSIPVPGLCYGITTINNKLVVGCTSRRIFMLDDQTGEVVQTIHTGCIPVGLHTSGDRIFYCNINMDNPNLYCYSFTDCKVTKLTLPSRPYVITSLQDGSLYVVCRNGSVQHVSSDVQHYKPVELFKGHCIISYNVKQRKLFTYNKAVINVFHEI